MTDRLDLRGRWWLPEHQNHQVSGALTWSAEDGGTLDLHDELRPVARAAIQIRSGRHHARSQVQQLVDGPRNELHRAADEDLLTAEHQIS